MNGKKPAAEPVGAAEFAALVAPLALAENIAVAVSGGIDSMALAVLCRRWADNCVTDHRQYRVHALIVDHGFRQESADEARLVRRRLQDHQIPADILTRAGPAPASGKQALGRAARYELMAEWCRLNGFSDLLVAHHRDDQAETVVMRALAGSGIDGLAAMRPVRTIGDIRILRPLLSISRARLAQTCHAHGLSHVDDSSNQDPAYTRTRIRHWLSGQGALPVVGATSARMSVLASRAARTVDALTYYTDRAVADIVHWHRFGWARLAGDVLRDVPADIAIRVLAQVGAVAGGVELPLAQLERAAAPLMAGQARTLGRVEFRPLKNGDIGVWRQARHLPIAAWPAGHHEIVWDNRFRLWRADATHTVQVAAHVSASITVQDSATAVGTDGRPVAKALTPEGDITGADRRALMTAPVVGDHPLTIVDNFHGTADAAGPYAVFIAGPGMDTQHDTAN